MGGGEGVEAFHFLLESPAHWNLGALLWRGLLARGEPCQGMCACKQKEVVLLSFKCILSFGPGRLIC